MKGAIAPALVPFRGVVSGFGCYWAGFLQMRYQSTSSERRFHCSVCKKSFRLEKAAQLHLQQAHNSDGSIEIGAGPGCESNAAPSRPNSLPRGPTVISQPPESSTQSERSRPRRSRPIPKPLNTPEKEVPPEVIQEILDVWDKVGVQRLAGKFIHSSMIMKVSATRTEEKSVPLYDFTKSKADTSPSQTNFETHQIVSDSLYQVDFDDAYAMAPSESLSPFNAASCDNPLNESSSGFHETFRTTSKLVDPILAAPAAPPVTTFGQLPMFGQHQQPSIPSNALNGGQQSASSLFVASPFANAAATESPFSGRVVSSTMTPVASPSASQMLSSPFVSVSPFADGQTEAPPATSSATAVNTGSAVAAAAASPFATGSSVESVGSPFVSNGVLNFASMAPPPNFLGADFAAMSTEAASPVHQCDSCGRNFSTHEGLRMHAQAKHGVKLPRAETNESRKKKSVAELSAYIPSPVDLSMTSPFGVQDEPEFNWIETEIIPHAVAVSNITVTGKVLEVKEIDGKRLQITVFVSAETSDEGDKMTIICSDELSKIYADNIHPDDYLFVCGVLRLTSVHEDLNDKYYSTPVIHVASPAGLIGKI
ncbi:unnamed protein product [Phytomonas sp. EM1]|nr:unnamed protein product [Phytomonas sp. EM1]|eukprot:CCW63189.1 unnamed protein product [Phytomonas sp. isolate EM1]